MFKNEKGEEIYKKLLKKIEELDRKPSFTEVKNDHSLPDPNDYAYYFGSFTAAADKAWGEYSFRKRAVAPKIKTKPIK